MKQQSTLSHLHPFVVFWLGVLTGALIVGFLFLYRTLNTSDYSSAVLKYKSPARTSTTQQFRGSYMVPSYGIPTPDAN